MTETNPAAKPTPAPVPKIAPAQVKVPVSDAAAAEAATWGRVDAEGKVWLRTADGEREVGQYAAGGTEQDALSLYVRRYLDLAAQVALLENRVEKISPEEARKSLKSLNADLVEPAVIGDVDSLRNRCAALSEKIEERAQVVAAQRAEAKEKALVERTAIVEAAEAIAAQAPEKTHWRDSRTKFNELLDQWKSAQRNSARIDRPTEDALWKRFSAARTQFDRHLRHHFSELDAQRKNTVSVKEELIAAAEALQDSTDWNNTAAQFRNLLEDWKRAGRSSRKDDDRLWERFRAAQQKFFDARSAYNAQLDTEFQANLVAKLELLAEAEKLVPVTDVEFAKEQIRAIGDKWDAIGRVPRADISRTEGRLRDIEREIRDAENRIWAETDPEKEERSSGMAAQLEALIKELEGEIKEAREAGNEKKLKELEESLAARKSWLEAVRNG
ncbi:MAG: DUF349 domain-containing protein [Arcanobacterium sp.]|nr:DUF349 domain-containing protein [Arcanobacterium sp.]